MTRYKKFKYEQKGVEKILYQREGRLVSAAKVPQEVIDSDIFGGTIFVEDGESDTPALQTPEKLFSKECIFCGEHAIREKFVNLQKVYLCEKDYLNNSTGKIVAKLRT